MKPAFWVASALAVAGIAVVTLSLLPLELAWAPAPQQSPDVKLQKEMARKLVIPQPGVTGPPSSQPDGTSATESPEPAPSGTLRIKGSSRVGCISETRYERLLTFASQDDNEAFKKELLAGMLEKDCTVFNENEPVYVSGGNALGRVRLRRPGETAEYQAPKEAAE
jgi:hypothetical protein